MSRRAISVVDAQLRIVAWNRRYLELLGYPDGMVFVGRPVVDLLRWNAERGDLGPGDPAGANAKSGCAHLRAGTAYTFQRARRNGQVYSIHGQPMAGGGFVTTYTDITEFKRNEQALLDAKQGLEERVAHRTQELSASLEAQRAGQAGGRNGEYQQDAIFRRGQPRSAAAAQCRETVRVGSRVAGAGASGIAGIGRAASTPRCARPKSCSTICSTVRAWTAACSSRISASFPIIDLLEELRRQYAPLAQARHLRLDDR